MSGADGEDRRRSRPVVCGRVWRFQVVQDEIVVAISFQGGFRRNGVGRHPRAHAILNLPQAFVLIRD